MKTSFRFGCLPAIVAFLILSLPALAPAQKEKFVARSHTYNGFTIVYRLFIPDSYSPTGRYPIIMVHHAAGEEGSDNQAQLDPFAVSWADPALQAQHPCFVVVPQAPFGWDISTSLLTANNILDSLGREFSIDTNRLFLAGGSAGGTAVWSLISRFPGRFAAAIPIAGWTDPTTAGAIGDISIWDFHGSEDFTVPAPQSRSMMNALRAAGRVVYTTECQNPGYSEIPGDPVETAVRSHEDLLYTECQGAGHGGCMPGPFAYQWIFDQYRKKHGAITLTSLKSHQTLTGTVPVVWQTASPGDSVEIWFSPDAGMSWQLITGSTPNTGTYSWNTATLDDCSFGQIKVFLKNADGHIYGADRSRFFAVSNGINVKPFVRIVNEDFCPYRVFKDSLDLRLWIGHPKASSLAVKVLYTPDGGSTIYQADAFTISPDTLIQTRRISFASYENCRTAMLKVLVTDGSASVSSLSSIFEIVAPTSVVGSAGVALPMSYMLHQNYPNPFNPCTTIKFELPKTLHVSLKVYDVLGRDVSVLVNERREAGVHEVKFDGAGLASGVYFYRLQAGDYVQTKKLMIVR